MKDLHTNQVCANVRPIEDGFDGAGGTAERPAADEKKLLARAATASFIGNFVEWYDYAAYGYLATVIAAVFFPNVSPASGLLATFGVFAISFVVRPIGGIIWGHFGDKIGRRLALSLSIVIMSASTFVIAILPSYAQVGLLAPLLLLVVRLVQGFSASGEYAGASTFIAEYAPPKRRGMFTSVVPASTAAGLLFGSLLVTFLTQLLGHDGMVDYGWRLPFLLAAPLGLIGRYIRVKLEDTPQFREMEEEQHVSKIPLFESFAVYRRAIFIGLGVTCLNAVGFYILLSYMPTYLASEIGLGQSESFLATTAALAVYIGLIFIMGRLSDRFGRKAMLMLASVSFIVLTVPLFLLMSHIGFVGLVLIQILFGALLAMNDGTLACFLTELFPTKVRYSGFAFSFNISNAMFGGTAPFIAIWLIGLSGSQLAPGWYLMGAAVVALIAILASRETAGRQFTS